MSNAVLSLDKDDPYVTTCDHKQEGKRDNDSGDAEAAFAREEVKEDLFFVLEYVTHDLTSLMDTAYPFTNVQINSLFQQLLSALNSLHNRKLIHRDVRANNIMVDSKFRLKLPSFGLARSLEPPLPLEQLGSGPTANMHQHDLTNKVVTLWHRWPKEYSFQSHFTSQNLVHTEQQGHFSCYSALSSLPCWGQVATA